MTFETSVVTRKLEKIGPRNFQQGDRVSLIKKIEIIYACFQVLVIHLHFYLTLSAMNLEICCTLAIL